MNVLLIISWYIYMYIYIYILFLIISFNFFNLFFLYENSFSNWIFLNLFSVSRLSVKKKSIHISWQIIIIYWNFVIINIFWIKCSSSVFVTFKINCLFWINFFIKGYYPISFYKTCVTFYMITVDYYLARRLLFLVVIIKSILSYSWS